jgi:hypothetical protein
MVLKESESDHLEKSLQAILKKWKFPPSIIEKYNSVGIHEIFEWQAECLSNDLVKSNF